MSQKKYDVVYTIKNGSKYGDDFELRYSLRSLAIQPWVGNIYLVGYAPSWVALNPPINGIFHLPCDDTQRNKDANIIRKVLTACGLPQLSEDFIVNSDDHYILGEVGIGDLGPWLESEEVVAGFIRRALSSIWCRHLVNTLNFCKATGRPRRAWECHAPYLVNKTLYQKLMPTAPWQKGRILSHIYYNLLDIKEPKQATPSLCLRVKQLITPGQLRRGVEGKKFLNHTDIGLCPAVREYLNELYPVPSKWEADA